MRILAILPGDSRAVRLIKFIRDVHPPATYAALSILWSLSLMMVLQRTNDSMHSRTSMGLVCANFFLVLLFLRAIDEIKDLDYDRRHNAERPLVRGDVSVNEVWTLAGMIAVAVLILNSLIAPILVLFTAAEMAYGVLLLFLERHVGWFRKTILLNLAITFPVSAALNAYAYLYLREFESAPDLKIAVLVFIAYMSAFLHFEFGRKLKWAHLSAPDENGYATAIGTGGALATCWTFGALACCLSMLMHIRYGAGQFAWLPWLALLPSLTGSLRFLRRSNINLPLKPYFGGFLFLFFALNLLVAAL